MSLFLETSDTLTAGIDESSQLCHLHCLSSRHVLYSRERVLLAMLRRMRTTLPGTTMLQLDALCQAKAKFSLTTFLSHFPVELSPLDRGSMLPPSLLTGQINVTLLMSVH